MYAYRNNSVGEELAHQLLIISLSDMSFVADNLVNKVTNILPTTQI